MDCRFIRRAACAAVPFACAFAPIFLGARAGADLVFSTWTSSDTPGSWSQAARWNPPIVPNNGGDVYDVLIDSGGKHSSTVYLDIAVVIRKLQIDAGDTLQQLAGTSFGITGETFSNSGAYVMASNGYNTDLFIAADCTIGEGGSITTSNTLANRIYASPGGMRITHGAAHTIGGSFQLGLNQTLLTNHGLIDGNGSSGVFLDLLDAGPNINDGTIRASNGGYLRIYPSTIQNAGGVIEATTGGALQLSDSTIIGGILRDGDGTGGSAWVGNVNTCSLSGVRIEGGFHCAAGTGTSIYETIDLAGPFFMDSNGYNTDLVVGSPEFSLGGAGGVVCSATLANRIYASPGTNRMTIPAGQSITGGFQLGLNSMQLTNHGTIEGSSASGSFLDLLDAGTHFNDGTIRAGSGGWLRIYPGTIQNAGGVIEATGGGALQLQDCSISDGVLRDADGTGGPSWIGNVNTCTLNSARIEGGFHCAAGTWTGVHDTIDLAGPLFMDSNGYNTDLIVGSPEFDLGGAGGVVCSATLANRIYGSPNTNRMTIPAGQSISGGFQLGLNSMQLTNHGTIEGSSASGSYLDLLDAGINLNDGTIRASGGGSLRIFPGTIDNTGGVIEAVGTGILQLQDSTISGGILRDGGGQSWIGNVNTCTLTSVRLEGAFHCAAGTFTAIVDSIDLAGTLFVDSNGYNTDLTFGGATCTLGGTGTIRCTNVASNRLYPNGASSVVIGPGVTIAGAFQLSSPSATITNNGTILVDSGATAYIDPPNGGGYEFLNNGTLAASGGSIYIYSSTFHNAGQARIDPGYGITIESNWWQTAGRTTVNGSLTSYGTVVLDGGELAGAGSVNAPVANNAGTVAPGNSPGILATQAYSQGVAAALSVEIGGTNPGTGYDCLSVLGPASLAGTLTVSRINGFVPTEGQIFTVLVCTGGRTGTFQAVQSCDNVELIYGANSVSLRFLGEYTRVADINHDGVVNGADLGLLLGGWGACVGTCCDGDLNGDGLVNGADLGLLLGNWG